MNQASQEFLKGKLSHIPILGNIANRIQIKKAEKAKNLLGNVIKYLNNNDLQSAEKYFIKYEKCNRETIKPYEKATYEKVSLELGYRYLFGNSVEKNLDKALDSFGKAGPLRSGLADKIYSWKNRGLKPQDKYFYLAEIFIDSIKLNTKSSLKETYMREAISYYELAGKAGCIEAYLRLSPIYFYGIDIEKNIEKTVDCLEKAVKLSSSEVSCLKVEPGSSAVFFRLKEAELNHSAASSRLRTIYPQLADIHFEKEEFKKAINYYEKAAEKLHPQACKRLFEIYSQGIEGHIEASQDLAKKYLEKTITSDTTIPFIDKD